MSYLGLGNFMYHYKVRLDVRKTYFFNTAVVVSVRTAKTAVFLDKDMSVTSYNSVSYLYRIE